MTLSEIWLKDPEQIAGKQIRQVIAFCGSGQLRDTKASAEFRDFLMRIPSGMLVRYANECVSARFDDRGFVLQDLINQVGRRLGFSVTDGLYAGVQGQVGFDGLWHFPDGRVVLVEVKSSDTYSFSLDTIAGYREALIVEDEISEPTSSILIVVGQENTGNLEAQIRGSRYAWNIRLISVDALLSLMSLRERVEDPKIVRKIWDILTPREFTKLDDIIELVFSTAEDVSEEEGIEEIEGREEIGVDELPAPVEPKFKPVAFNEACAERVQERLGIPLLRRSRAQFSSADEAVRLVCAVARELKRPTHSVFWFAFHPHQEEFLNGAREAYVAFGCGSPEVVILIPFVEFRKWLPRLNRTEGVDRSYWHVHIMRQDNHFELHQKEGAPRVDLTSFLLPTQAVDGGLASL